jgi:hypothetical protein
VKEALHLGVRRALSEDYVKIPDEELDAIDEEVLEPVKTLAAKFEDEIVPPPLELVKKCRARCLCKNLEYWTSLWLSGPFKNLYLSFALSFYVFVRSL